MKKIILAITLCIGILVAGTIPAMAVLYGFGNITHNGNEDLSDQLWVDVLADNGGVMFTFTNWDPVDLATIDSAITDVYFDDADPMLLAQITSFSYTGVVAFASPATPPVLPGGSSITPAFVVDFSADADSMTEAVDDGNVDSLTVHFALNSGFSYASVLHALNSGDLRIGLHVQSIGTRGGSDSYVNRVPEPGTILLLGFGLAGLYGYRLRKRGYK